VGVMRVWEALVSSHLTVPPRGDDGNGRVQRIIVQRPRGTGSAGWSLDPGGVY